MANEPDRAVEKVWALLGDLTYSQMMEVAMGLRDAYDARGQALAEVSEWAAILELARATAMEEVGDETG